MSKRPPSKPEEQITGIGPFDIVKIYSAEEGRGGAVLYRTHRDQIDEFSSGRTTPGLFIMGILTMSLAQVMFAKVTTREWDGLIGACNYAAETVDESQWGTSEKVNKWIRGG